MKNRLLVIGAAMLTFSTVSVSAQKLSSKEVPSVILNNFQTKFRNAEDVEWKLKNGYYKVEFEVAHRDYEIKYDTKGAMLSYEEEMDTAAVPQPVRAAAMSKHPGTVLTEAKKIETGAVTYKIEVKNNAGDEWDLVIDPAGKIISDKRD
ncbi:Putative beta-lactamase-inhibitor-like, PepSY-like [Chitinophaga sp. YR627]|uniref:PepSY domain-containing protein n=1 Tax=Chitinophaga sp. YR627 TaxID=1881041 RepID=UPI0008E07980|nr:PepSY domain-containing protein [Chitinophaga sp. YR627]SFM69369.1 Putative beta-lactamase-inhibitor-like, PepSY-like [Chitinophaga sp. YR627]